MRSTLFSVVLSSLAIPAFAQLPLVDIGMAPLADGRLEVRLRPDGDFSGLFSALVFTVRYPEGSTATLGDFTALPGNQFSGVYPDVSGEIQFAGGYAYATYAGFGFSTTNPAWTGGGEMILGHFAVLNGPGDFSMVDDAWTASHNGDFYVSLNGAERTGLIYQLSTGVQESSTEHTAFVFNATPGSDHGTVVIDRMEAGLLLFELIDGRGRIVQQWSEATAPGNTVLNVHARVAASGLYHLRAQERGAVFNAPWYIEAR